MQRILIGFDGSERGDDALVLGRVLAGASDTPHVVVATVYEALIPRDAHGHPSLREQRLRHAAEEALERARTAWPELPEASFVAIRASSPSAGLQRLALDGDFDVVVVGASHRHGLGRMWPGSATEQTLQGAPRPVAVAPPGFAVAHRAGDGLQRIGVAYDGSVEARHALELAAELAVRAEATVVAVDVVHSEGVPLTDAYGYGSFVAGMREISDRHLRGAQRALEQRGVRKIETERLEGVPARELIEASERLDLLVLGSRGHGPALRLLLGTVSARVVRGAACPVLLFPRSATEDGEPRAGETAAARA